ncbi:MAG: hypothetical protein EOO47_18745 [Flavobacterium sp.]|nr:MAG: hypothetical protein EOO47_18745 [Flavobacterium sp.]
MKKICIIVLMLSSHFAVSGKAVPTKEISLQSPNGKLKTIINIEKQLSFMVFNQGNLLLSKSYIALELTNGEVLGKNAVVKEIKKIIVDTEINAPFYKRKVIADKFNQYTIYFQNDFSVIFRAYDEGIAYRFTTAKKKDFIVENEVANFNFFKDCKAFVPYVKGNGRSIESEFFNSFENEYTEANLSKLDTNKLAFLPLVVVASANEKVCITEADLEDYPGMFLNAKAANFGFKGVFANYPTIVKQGGHNDLQGIVKTREKYIAKCEGTRNFPWRIISIVKEDKELADNDLVYKLASSSRIQDCSWVKPGKVAWEWWNDWNIKDVDFKSGINAQTYKVYIDFASKNNLEYVILDEGWAVDKKADLLQVVPEIDIKDLVDYAKQKNVGIILWAGYYAFDQNMEQVVKHYANLGVKGFKNRFYEPRRPTNG